MTSHTPNLLSNNDVTSMVAHIVQAVIIENPNPAQLCPGSALAQDNQTGIREEPEGAEAEMVQAPPPAWRPPHELNKGGVRKPKSGYKATWPHDRPAFRAEAARAAAAAVQLLNPGARFSDIKF